VKRQKEINFKQIKDMLTNVNPKLPMRNKSVTKDFYVTKLGFQNVGSSDYDGYLMVEKDSIEIHFFEFKELSPNDSYSGVYIRTDDIDNLYQSLLDNKVPIHPNGALQEKPWGQKEFALLDPDNNLLTFGQGI
jgi:catechol 2,3-dioxygenase-like lactoylglutathione lyase family enzyme